jgi:hypothetical protein
VAGATGGPTSGAVPGLSDATLAAEVTWTTDWEGARVSVAVGAAVCDGIAEVAFLIDVGRGFVGGSGNVSLEIGAAAVFFPRAIAGVLSVVVTGLAIGPAASFLAVTAAAFVEAARVAFLTGVTGDCPATTDLAAASAFFCAGVFGETVELLLVLKFFFGTLTTSSATATVFLARGFATVVARRRLCCNREAETPAVALGLRRTRQLEQVLRMRGFRPIQDMLN